MEITTNKDEIDLDDLQEKMEAADGKKKKQGDVYFIKYY